MHFAHLTKGLALLSFIYATQTHDTSSHYPYIRNDLQCPEGSHVSFLHNSYAYQAPLHKFTDITKSFFHIAWYGGVPANVTTGTVNVPGATRGGPYYGGTFNETLTMYLTHPDVLNYTIHGKPVTFLTPNRAPIHFDGYAETMRFESICGGRATYIDLITYICSEDQATAYDVWYTLHMVTFEGLAAKIGALVLPGDCPRVSLEFHENSSH
ncbi:hypothetical protein B0H11DRAFT_1901158 [Mycena galericulata]|nr:hypothetical protein B0H11DRAFT_1901158 [Mycena galericulata]